MNKEDEQNNKMNSQPSENFEKGILSRIESENIKPKSKLELSLTNIYVWLIIFITLVLGALSVSATIFVFENIDWQLYSVTHDNIWPFLFEFFPYLWITLFIILIVVAHKIVRLTKKGYKYHLFLISCITLFMTFILGITLHSLGLGEIVDKDFGDRIPFHKNIEMHNQMIWNNPEMGILMGKIVREDDQILLKNFEGRVWALVIDELDEFGLDRLENILAENKDDESEDEEDENDFDGIGYYKDKEGTIHLIGIDDGETFYVCRILPNISEMKKDIGQGVIFERKVITERSKECEALRPYRRLLETNQIN